MTGVTGLRPLTNDPVGTQKQKNGNLEEHSTTNPNEHGSNIVKAKGMYVRDSMNKPIAGNDKYSDDETVKTAHSTMNTVDLTIATETTYDNVDDDQTTLPAETEWIPVTNKTPKRKKSVLTANSSEYVSTSVKTLIKNRC